MEVAVVPRRYSSQGFQALAREQVSALSGFVQGTARMFVDRFNEDVVASAANAPAPGRL